MEILHNINITDDRSTIRPVARLALTVIGVVAAVICWFTLRSEVRSSEKVATVSNLMDAAMIVPRDFSVGINSVNLVSAKWPF